MAVAKVWVALEYAGAGFKVFPCNASKEPLTFSGHKDASNEYDQVKAWWTQFPDALIGLPCASNGLVVVDCDTYKNPMCLAQLEEKASVSFAEHPYRVRTMRGGTHLYFKAPAGFDPRYKLDNIEAIEVKYRGYVIAADNDQYRLVQEPKYGFDAHLLSRLELSIPPTLMAVLGKVLQQREPKKLKCIDATRDGFDLVQDLSLIRQRAPLYDVNDYDDWMFLGRVINHRGGPQDLWDRLSYSSNKYNQSDGPHSQDAEWDRMRDDKQNVVTFATFIYDSDDRLSRRKNNKKVNPR